MDDIEFPSGHANERELLLQWLDYLRKCVLANLEGLDDDQARWTPGDTLISVLGVVNHLTRVEWRWIDGAMLGEEVERSEAEFHPGADITVDGARSAYRARAADTNDAVRRLDLTTPCARVGPDADLRWVLLHLINETARHAGHADATRELIDGARGDSPVSG